MANYTIDSLGYDRTLTKTALFQAMSEDFAEGLESSLPNYFTNAIAPEQIQSGELSGNLNVVQGYLQSANFTSGVTGWKFDAVGNLEANSGTFRGSIYAASGDIGDWILDTTGFYYDGTGDPSIRTAISVGEGSDGVILDSAGIRVYNAVIGQVVNLPSDGSAPSFASGIIENTTFEINTNAVLRTSSTVGDGTSASAGVLINNSGFYACEANQDLDDANIRITKAGNGYFTGTINASTVNSSTLNSVDINGSTITGGLFRTAESGQRTVITNEGVALMTSGIGVPYGSTGDTDYRYGENVYTYGSGALGYINNSTYKVPFYINSEQTVADLHLYNRSAQPTGAAEIGDLAVIGGILSLCTTAGTPGDWESVAALDTVIHSQSPSASPSISPSVSPSISPSISSSISPSISSSISPSPS